MFRSPKPDLDVVIVGAGPAGLGVANVLRELDIDRYRVLERGDIGESFSRWPREMRFITPSFPAHGFGQLDLNAFVPRSSPGLTLKSEHLSGRHYAAYLRGITDHFCLNVQTKIEVRQISRRNNVMHLDTSSGKLSTRFVVWAGGEFQYPRIPKFEGAHLCLHNSTVVSWEEIAGNDPLIIGGNESGIDSAVHLSRRCNSVRVIDPNAAWDSAEHDPSLALSPFTQDRLRVMQKDHRIELMRDEVVSVEREGDEFLCTGESGVRFLTDSPPILATGFETSLRAVRDLFSFDQLGQAMLTEHDESTKTAGVFLAGPMIRHQKQVFCFIYKFGQRFAIVGCEIARRLGVPTEQMERTFRAAGMFLDDLSCCVNQCDC